MGIVESFAFLPPNRERTKKLLRGADVRYVTNSVGHKIALVHFDARTDITVLYSHGNAEDIGVAYQYFTDLSRLLGANLVVYDYSGYGLSEGTCSEANAYSSINAVFDYVLHTLNVPRDKIILFGRSLGSGPTVDLGSRERGLGGMVLQSPLATAMATTTVSIPIMDIFMNRHKIGSVSDYPVLIIHGEADTVVPCAHGKELHDILDAKKSKTFVGPAPPLWLRGCGHNDIEYHEPDKFYRTLAQFVVDVRNKKYIQEASKRADGTPSRGSAISSLSSSCS
eukprot:PhF_6_TR13053/c0_g1_i1/m.20723